MPAEVLVDTGPLVALFNRDDPLHARASAWPAAQHGALHTVDTADFTVYRIHGRTRFQLELMR